MLPLVNVIFKQPAEPHDQEVDTRCPGSPTHEGTYYLSQERMVVVRETKQDMLDISGGKLLFALALSCGFIGVATHPGRSTTGLKFISRCGHRAGTRHLIALIINRYCELVFVGMKSDAEVLEDLLSMSVEFFKHPRGEEKITPTILISSSLRSHP